MDSYYNRNAVGRGIDGGNRACKATADNVGTSHGCMAGTNELPCTVAAIHPTLTCSLKQIHNVVPLLYLLAQSGKETEVLHFVLDMNNISSIFETRTYNSGTVAA